MTADETSHEPSAAPAGPSASAPPPVAVASVARERRDDPLTGLPLLRYRFTGLPTLRPGDPSPTGAWRVLRVDRHDGSTTLDLEIHAGARSLADHAAGIDDAVAAAALAALADARALGVAHGDLGAHRLWRRGDRIWVEGYGVPWREGATVGADARALAADLLAITGTGLGAAMRERLAAVRDGGDPAAVATAHPARATVDAAPARSAPRLVRGPPPGATLRPGATRAWQRAVRDVRDAVRASVTRRHALMALALVLAAGVWLGLASWSPPVPAAAIFVSRVVGHVVDVRIEPTGLPPVSLVVVESPAGSRLPPGTVVGSVPSKVLLDREGVWRFQARFGGTSSQIVVLVAPDEPVLVVPFPSPPPATAR